MSAVTNYLDTRPDLACQVGHRGFTAMHCATMGDQPKIIAVLHGYKADVNAADERGRAPLHYACHRNNVRALDQLLNFEANPDQEDQTGSTPLLIAYRYDSLAVFLRLKERVNEKIRGNRQTLFFYYFQYHQIYTKHAELERYRYASDLDIDPNMLDRDGKPVLQKAVEQKDYFSVLTLLAREDIELEYRKDPDTMVEILGPCNSVEHTPLDWINGVILGLPMPAVERLANRIPGLQDNDLKLLYMSNPFIAAALRSETHYRTILDNLHYLLFPFDSVPKTEGYNDAFAWVVPMLERRKEVDLEQLISKLPP